MKKTISIILALAFVLALVGCGPKAPQLAQGIDATNHVINVGNTAATTGAFAGVGVPFNYAQEAYFWYFANHTDGYKDADGNSYTINLKHYDDGFDGVAGKTYITSLVTFKFCHVLLPPYCFLGSI